MLSPSGPRLSHELAAAHERARDVMSSGDAVCPTPQSGPLALTLSQTLHSRRARHAVWHQACGQVTDQSHAAAARSYTQEQLRAAAKMFEGMAMIQESMENKKEAIHFIQLALEAQVSPACQCSPLRTLAQHAAVQGSACVQCRRWSYHKRMTKKRRLAL